MLYDNAELLSLYSIAYKVFGKELYKRTAEGIVNYYRLYGYDPQGGFYTSQDADIGMLDEGGYYTFTQKEIEALLSPEELKVFSLYFGLADMPHEPHKKVLYVYMEEGEVSKATGLSSQEVKNLLESSKRKLLQHREKRQMPYIDKTLYTNWNALMVSGLCDYWKVFSDPWAIQSAEKTVKRLIDQYYKDDVLFHTDGVEGFSEDYVFFANALLSLYEIRQENTYLEVAKQVMKKAIELFWDRDGWGFYDNAGEGKGLLNIRLKNLQDTPTQSVNGSASYILLLLGTLTGDGTFIDYGEKTLQAFSRFVREVPMASHSYLISLYAYLRGIYKVETRDYFEQALKFFRPFKFVLRSEVDGVVVCEGQVCQRFEDFIIGK